jgi:two-component system chemotaxis response regulator CheY
MVKTVLIVDDSTTSRNIIKKEVEKLGHKVIGEAQDGWEGLHRYQELKPDIILSDIEMPNLNGYDMLEQLLKLNKDIKVAYITSVVNAQLIKKLLALGAFYSITKPINSTKLKVIFDKLEG